MERLFNPSRDVRVMGSCGARYPSLRLTALLTLLTFVPACSAWHQKRPPGQYVIREQPERVRVTDTRGNATILRSPAVVGDSLVGEIEAGDWDETRPRRTSIPLIDLQKLEVRELDAFITSLPVIGGVGLVVALAVAASNPLEGATL